ncbi:MAG: LacI family transcriptional regulator, partial [Propionibacteriales bacterium]|nr:LacI family transcriptional regulator [Propionibacteriales bacterium]
MTRVTMRDVAATAGVTKMSVSNAFSRPDRISVELRKRILDVASELGYHGPDARARALARGRTGLVGVLLSGSAADAFVDATAVTFIGGVVAALSERSLSVGLIAPPAASTPLPARDLAMDGALVYASDPDDPGYRALVERALPVVTIDQLDGLAGHGVVVDDRGGAAAATRHLVDLGHERIAILAPRPTPNFSGHVT